VSNVAFADDVFLKVCIASDLTDWPSFEAVMDQNGKARPGSALNLTFRQNGSMRIALRFAAEASRVTTLRAFGQTLKLTP
jgi:hypothetical protein